MFMYIVNQLKIILLPLQPSGVRSLESHKGRFSFRQSQQSPDTSEPPGGSAPRANASKTNPPVKEGQKRVEATHS